MNILCKIFGHKIKGHTYSDSSYTRYLIAESGAVDNINRHHIRIKAECDRCGDIYCIGNIHGTIDGNIL